jgi:hypothetical protein
MARTTVGGRSTRAEDRTTNTKRRRKTVDDSEIALLAYTFYLARGSLHGHDLEDWLRAERELRAKSRPGGD